MLPIAEECLPRPWTMLLSVLALAIGTVDATQAETRVFHAAGAFEVAISQTGETRGIDRLFTTAAGVTLASEISSTPGPNTGVGNTLTFLQASTGLSRDYTLRTLQPGASFTFDDDEGAGNLLNFDNALSVGDIDNSEDDDWSVTLTTPVNAFGVVLKDNGTGVVEHLSLYSLAGDLLESVPVTTTQVNAQFIGVITDYPFYEVRFDEGSGGDDIAIANLRFPATTTDPLAMRYRDQFGNALDVTPDGDTLLVGARGSNTPGRLYVYDRDDSDQWRVVAILTSPEGVDDDNFAHAVAISDDGNTVVASAPTHDLVTGTAAILRNAGAAYVYSRHGAEFNDWPLVRKLSPLDRAAGSGAAAEDRFGQGVDITGDGDIILVGSPGSDVVSANRGLVYEFRRDLGGQDQWGYLRQYDGGGSTGDRCGQSVAVSGDGSWIAAGCTGAETETDTSVDNGRVALFPVGGSRQTSLDIDNYTAGQQLGVAVDINVDGTVVAAKGLGGGYNIVTRPFPASSSWATDFASPQAGDGSAAVSEDGSTALVGWHDSDDLDTNAGRVTGFRYQPAGYTGCPAGALCYAGDLLSSTSPPYADLAHFHLGASLALVEDGTLALVGAPKYSEPDDAQAYGEAFLYRDLDKYFSEWQYVDKLAPGPVPAAVEDMCPPLRAGRTFLTMLCL